MDWRIVSIGTLASNPLWNESGTPRTGHATTTIVKSGDAFMLIDPSLPAQMLHAKLSERWGIGLDSIDSLNINNIFQIEKFQPIYYF